MAKRSKRRNVRGENTSHTNMVLHLTEHLMQDTSWRPSSLAQATMMCLQATSFPRVGQHSGAEFQGFVTEAAGGLPTG